MHRVKKYLIIMLVLTLMTGTVSPRAEISVLAATKSTNRKAVQKTSDVKKKKTAQKYVGKKLKKLVKAIGKYKKLTRSDSCMYANEYDGIAKYSGFTVYCHTKKKVWYVDAVE
ncbi:MAG: hypothetical protein SOZ48_07945 [Eubacterium sp.]|nr:hypothetical protein [Eubacterium sp.]